MLQAPIEGYEDAIVVPQINANNSELKQTLINLVKSNQFTGRQDPHNHLRFFNKVTSTFRHPEDALDSAAGGNFLDKIPRECLSIIESKSKVRYSRSRVTDEKHESGFIKNLRDQFGLGKISYQSLSINSFPRLKQQPHQLDTFYNALNPNDQDALDSAAGGNFLDKIPRECLSIIESKSKVRYSRSRVTNDALDSAAGGNFLDKIPRECLSIIESKSKARYSRSRVTDVRENVNAPLSSSSHSNSFDLQQIAAALEDKLDIRMNRFEKSLNEMKNSLVTPTTPLNAVTEVWVYLWIKP
nr:hypothetical protein [Tanacetum cinerariifolium]